MADIKVGKKPVVGRVKTGRGSHGVAVDPSSRRAYVTNLYEH